MKRCPECGSGAEFTNKVEYYSKHVGAGAVGFGAGALTELVHPHGGGHIAKEVHENLTKSVYKHYKCTNPKCRHEWDEH